MAAAADRQSFPSLRTCSSSSSSRESITHTQRWCTSLRVQSRQQRRQRRCEHARQHWVLDEPVPERDRKRGERERVVADERRHHREVSVRASSASVIVDASSSAQLNKPTCTHTRTKTYNIYIYAHTRSALIVVWRERRLALQRGDCLHVLLAQQRNHLRDTLEEDLPMRAKLQDNL